MWIKDTELEVGAVEYATKCESDTCKTVVAKGELMIRVNGLILMCLDCLKGEEYHEV